MAILTIIKHGKVINKEEIKFFENEEQTSLIDFVGK